MKSSNIIVRYATDSDLPAIERHHGGRLDRIGDPFCDVAHIQNNRLDWLLIAELDGKYAGFLYWHLGQKPFFASEVEKFAHIRQISVLEEFQGQGIAKKLMVYATERLKSFLQQLRLTMRPVICMKASDSRSFENRYTINCGSIAHPSRVRSSF